MAIVDQTLIADPLTGAGVPFRNDMVPEIQTTGQFRGRTAYVFNLVGERAGFTSITDNNDIKEYDNSVARAPVYSNAALDIISSSTNDTAAGTGARTVRVVYINASNNLVESSPIALNGTTLVTNVLTGVNQVLWMEVDSVGSGVVAAGNIRLRINGGAVEVEQITALTNKSKSAMFMVPVGYTGYVVSWFISAVNNDQIITLEAQANTLDGSISDVYHAVATKYAAANTTVPDGLFLFTRIPALARIKASTVSGGTGGGVKASVNVLLAIIED